MFSPLTTDRLLLRSVQPGDVGPLQARRSHPEVARLQSWATPFPPERATALVEASQATPDPVDDQWFMITIADRDDTEVVGDLALKLSWEGRAAEIGWTLAHEHWGNGYAVEAAARLVQWLFEYQNVTRIQATMHPENFASARVAESTGFVFEGHTRNSYWVGDENSDDWIYGITPDLWHHWITRPRTAPDVVTLVEPYPVGLRDVVKLETHHSQKRFVAPIVTSLAQVAVPPPEEGNDLARVKPWPRIIHADDEAVGFVMLEEPTSTAPEPYLWRLLIDRRHQGRGIASEALRVVIDQVREWGAESLLVSYVEGIGSPRSFYDRLGFVPTGEVDDGETVARLVLDEHDHHRT